MIFSMSLILRDDVVIPLDKVQLDDKLHFVKEPVEIMDREEPMEIIDREEQVSSSLCKKIRDKARQASGRRFLKEGKLIDYDEVFIPVARIEALRIFLAFASYMGFIVYQIDVKSAFLYGIIDEEVYVLQPPGFVDPKFPNKNQLLDYGFNFMNTKIYIDNESTICIVKNPVFNSKTKHIEIRYHFIRDAYEKKLIQVLKIHIHDNVADFLNKAFDVSSNEALAILEQTATCKEISNPFMAGSLPKTTLPTSTMASSIICLATNQKFYFSRSIDEVQIQALIDENRVNIKESSICRTLKLDDAEGISCLANADIFDGLAKMGYEKLSEKLTFYKAFF
nr:putative ribonuclease H-like domain-containing protein [Tanacetum cinerariifolium]